MRLGRKELAFIVLVYLFHLNRSVRPISLSFNARQTARCRINLILENVFSSVMANGRFTVRRPQRYIFSFRKLLIFDAFVL